MIIRMVYRIIEMLLHELAIIVVETIYFKSNNISKFKRNIIINSLKLHIGRVRVKYE